MLNSSNYNADSTLKNITINGVDHFYQPNVNLEVDEWLGQFELISSASSLGLAVLTFIFQMTHPKSR